MAESPEMIKPKKSKDRSEKKKRKHDQDGVDESASPTKKSKSANPGKDLNGSLEKLSADQMQLATEFGSSFDSVVNGHSEIPSKKKKSKNKSQDESKIQTEGLAAKKPDISTPKSKAKNGNHPSIENPMAPSDSSKSKDGPQENGTPADPENHDPLPMEIDLDINMIQSSLTPLPQDTDPTAYIERPLKAILSHASLDSTHTKESSPFYRQATQLYLPLAPITLPSPLAGLCAEHLSPLLLKYYAPLHGVILSYAHPRFSNDCVSGTGAALAVSVAEYATPMVWIDVEFLLFKPKRGHVVEGRVVLQNESHIGLQVYNLFSARIAKDRLPTDWSWKGAEKGARQKARKGKLKGGDGPDGDTETDHADAEIGGWIDGDGKKVDGVISFRVWDVEIAFGGKDAERNLPVIEGSLAEDDGEDEQSRREVRKGKRRA